MIALDVLIGEQGATGLDGRELLLQVVGGFIQYQYEGDLVWNDLIELSSLIGPQGLPGIDGKEIELRVNENQLEWRYQGDLEWQFIYDLMLLKGQDAVFPVVTISVDGYWVIDGVKTTNPVIPVETFNVTFNLEGGNFSEGIPTVIEVVKGNSLELPIPTNEGYKFSGWFTGDTVNDTQFNNYLPVTKDINLYAKWILDYDYINSFFLNLNDTNQLDHTLNFSMTNGVDTYYLSQIDSSYLYLDDTESYRYYQSSSSFNIPIFGAGSRSGFQYDVYYNSLNEHILIENTYNPSLFSPWSLYKNNNMDLQLYDLSFMNPLDFVKQEGFMIYNYAGDLTGFDNLFFSSVAQQGLTMPSTSTFTTRNCTLNLDTMVLNYSTSGFVTLFGMGDFSFSYDVNFDLNDFNELTMTLPFEVIKQDFVDYLPILVQAVYSYHDINEIEETSILAFETLVDEKSLILLGINNIYDLTDFYQYDLFEIRYFEFAFDWIAIMKNDVIMTMQIVFDQKSILASDDSINDMLDVLNQYQFMVQSLDENFVTINEEMLQIILDDFYIDIASAYMVDLEKIAFNDYRNQKAEQLNIFYQYAGDIFVNPEDFNFMLEFLETSIGAIKKGLSYTEVDSLYNSTVQLIINSGYVLNCSQSYLTEITDQFYWYLDSFRLSIVDQSAYQGWLYGELIYFSSITTYFDWVVYALTVYENSQLYIINANQSQITFDIETRVDELSLQISDDLVIKLEAQESILFALIPQMHYGSTMNAVLYYFDMYLDSLPLDPWKIALISAKNSVLDEFNFLSSTATLSSQALLQTEYDDFIEAVAFLTVDDIEGLDSLVQDTLTNFNLLYETAPELLELYYAKLSYQDKWEDFYLTGVVYVNTEYQQLDDLVSVYQEYRLLIRQALTIEEVELFYQAGQSILANMPIIYLDFYSLISEYQNMLSNEVIMWEATYGFTSFEATDHLYYFGEEIIMAMTPYAAYQIYQVYYTLIQDDILFTMQVEYADILFGYYQYSLQFVADGDYSFVQDIYMQSQIAIDNASEWGEFELIISNYLNNSALIVCMRQNYLLQLDDAYNFYITVAAPEYLSSIESLYLQATTDMNNNLSWEMFGAILGDFVIVVENNYIV